MQYEREGPDVAQIRSGGPDNVQERSKTHHKMQYQRESPDIAQIRSGGPNTAQCNRLALSSLHLMDACGREKFVDRIETNVNIEDFAPCEGGGVIATDFKGQRIVQISVYCKVEFSISTSPYHPTGICHLHDKSFMVAMHLGSGDFGKLRNYSFKGKTYQ